MASTKEYLDFVLEKINGMDITYKKMMGEYLLYANGVLFGKKPDEKRGRNTEDYRDKRDRPAVVK